MHVAELFDAFVLCSDIEIVEAALPDFSRRQGRCGVLRHSRLAQHLVGKALLQHLHRDRRRSLLRFADEQMEVFGHDHVSEHNKAVAFAGLLPEG